MSLTDELLAKQSHIGRKCLTCSFYKGLDPSVVEEINEAYNDDRITNAVVWRYVRDKYGVDFSDAAFHNHYRRGHDQR